MEFSFIRHTLLCCPNWKMAVHCWLYFWGSYISSFEYQSLLKLYLCYAWIMYHKLLHNILYNLHIHVCIYWSRKWQPIPLFLPGKSHGQRSLVGYSPWGRKELDMTDWLSTYLSIYLPRFSNLNIPLWYIYIEREEINHIEFFLYNYIYLCNPQCKLLDLLFLSYIFC